MSTRAIIGIRTKDGFIGAYNHFDGYPAGLLKTILEYLDTTSIQEFIECITTAGKTGGFRYFPEMYNDTESKPYTDEKQISHESYDYTYIFNEDKKLVKAFSFTRPIYPREVLEMTEHENWKDYLLED